MTPVSTLQHAREQPAIEADGSEQVGVDGVLPVLVAERQHPAARRGGATDIVDEDVLRRRVDPGLP